MVIYRSVAVRIYAKMHHLRVNNAANIRHGVNRFAFTRDFGDLPICRCNEITGKFEEVVNLRGRAYAAQRCFISAGEEQSVAIHFRASILTAVWRGCHAQFYCHLTNSFFKKKLNCKFYTTILLLD